MVRKVCPYLEGGQCTVAPKSIATSVVNVDRCYRNWRTCKLYRWNSKSVENAKNSNISSLEKYLKRGESGGPLVTGPCPYLISGYCILRRERLSSKEVEKCKIFWRECPDRLKSDKEGSSNGNKDLTSLINFILQSL